MLRLFALQAWVDAFLKEGRLAKSQLGRLLPPKYDVLSRTTSTIELVFSYANDIQFKIGGKGK